MFCSAVSIEFFKIYNGSVGTILFPIGKKIGVVVNISVISYLFNNLFP